MSPAPEAIPDTKLPWWEWELPSNKVTASPLKVTMLGYAVEDFADVGYQAFTALLHPEDYERSMQAMRDYLEGRVPLYQVDYRIRHRSGEYVWYVDRGSAVERGVHGQPTVLRGVVFNLGSVLPSAVDDALFRALREALTVPPAAAWTEAPPTVCMQCRRLKKATSQWEALPDAVNALIERPVSHGLCGPCAHELYPDVAAQLARERPDLF